VTPPKRRSKATRGYQRHGLTVAKQALKTWGDRQLEQALDGRTGVAKSLAAWKAALIDDLGGEDQVSAQQRTLIDLAVRTRFLLDGVDGWIFEQQAKHGPAFIINKRSRQLFRIVSERQSLANALASYMNQLGLERVAPVIDATALLLEDDGEEAL
jgi:chorismate mutase